MGFLERRRDRKLLKEVGPEAHASFKEAEAKYDRTIAQADERAARFTAELQRRMQEVEASPLDRYFQGVLCFSLGAGADILRAFGNTARLMQIESDDEGPPPSLGDYLDAIEDDEPWGRALGVGTWAYACRFVSINWPDRYDEVCKLAAVGLGEPSPSERQVMDAANYESGSARSYARFHRVHFEASHEAALARQPDDAVVSYAFIEWPAAWNEGFDLFNEQLAHYFPNGPPQDAQ